MAAQNNAALPEGLEVGGYRIVKKISSGGFSIVYLATDEQGTSVAIKEYMPAALASRKSGELSPMVAPEHLNTYRIGLKCFFEEGRALASIYHPNIVRVLNFFRANDTVYMVMHYESGRSLQEHVVRNRSKEQVQEVEHELIQEGDLSLVEKRAAEDPYCHRRVYVEVDITPKEARFLIRDDGNGFDLGEVPDLNEPGALEPVGRRGLSLIQTFMDEVLYNEKGNEVRLVKRAVS